MCTLYKRDQEKCITWDERVGEVVISVTEQNK